MQINFEEIIALERENMSPILERSGIIFEEYHLREDLLRPHQSIEVRRNDVLVGLLRYSKTDAVEIKIKSIQLRDPKNNFFILGELLTKGYLAIRDEKFLKVSSSALIANITSQELHCRLGFREAARSEFAISYEVSKEILISSFEELLRPHLRRRRDGAL